MKQAAARRSPRKAVTRDVAPPPDPKLYQSRESLYVPRGRSHLVTIGINRYENPSPTHEKWGRLGNAVEDAEGARRAFGALGFESCAHLTDGDATYEAMDRLTRYQLRRLDKDDSLVIFFAGHGFTDVQQFADTAITRTGYIVPVDAIKGEPGSCIKIATWLDSIARLAPRHILVILDSCKSGIALEPMMIWHSQATYGQVADPWERLRQRRSRRIFTSAADDEFASDVGPTKGHSLFTGYLVEALRGGMLQSGGLASAEEVSMWVKHHVMSFPGARQSPGFGALALHDHGDLVFSFDADTKVASADSSSLASEATHERGEKLASSKGKKVKKATKRASTKASRKTKGRTRGDEVPAAEPALTLEAIASEERDRQRLEEARREKARDQAERRARVLRRDAGQLDAGFAAALDRHAATRKHGAVVLSTVIGEPLDAAAAIATHAARHGALTLRTSATEIEAATAELLAHVPWARCLRTARARFAQAAKRPVAGLTAAFESRGEREIREWIEEVGRHDPAIQVAGWLAGQLHNPFAPLDVDTSPVKGRALLAAVGDLCGAIAIAIHHDEPTDAWLEGAVGVAAVLAMQLPRHAVSISAPADLATRVVVQGRDSSPKTMARQGMVRLPVGKAATGEVDAVLTQPRALEDLLLEALRRDPRTAGRFEHHVMAPIHERQGHVEVLAAGRRESLIVEIDRWYQLDDAAAYQQARLKDIWLRRAGFLCLRFPAEDVVHRLPAVLDEICAGLEGRRGDPLYL